MPANIPSPVVGAGGGQGGRPMFEQLLLTLAGAAPQMLMQFLDQRQEGQRQGQIDQAAQLGLGVMAADASPAEQAMMQQGGMNPGSGSVQSTQLPGSQSALMPGGMTAPAVAPMQAANQPSFAGMQPGVAAPLLEILQGLRTQRTQQDAAKASTKLAGAQTAAVEGQESRDRELHPGRMSAQQAEIDARRAEIDARTLEGRLAQQRMDLELKMFDLDTDRIRAAIANDDAAAARLATETRLLGSNMAGEHRREYQTTLNNLTQTMGAFMSREAIAAEASEIVFGVEMPPSPEELKTYWEGIAAGAEVPNLAAVIRDRVQQKYRVAPEQYQAIMADLQANQMDPTAALLQNYRRGASVDDLRIAARIYAIETGQPVRIPAEIHRSEVAKEAGNALPPRARPTPAKEQSSYRAGK